MTSELQTMSFDNDLIGIIEEGGQYFVAMKPMCEALGVEWKNQHRNITDDPVLSSTIIKLMIVGKDGKEREMVCLPLDYLNGWLFKLDANLYQGERREKIIRYQLECYRVLADHFLPRISAEENKAMRIEFNRLLERQDFLEAQVDCALSLAGQAYKKLEDREEKERQAAALEAFQEKLKKKKRTIKWINRLITYRNKKDLTQRETGRLLGTNRDEVQLWERLMKKSGLWPGLKENRLPLVPEIDYPKMTFIPEGGPSANPERMHSPEVH